MSALFSEGGKFVDEGVFAHTAGGDELLELGGGTA